MRHDLAPRVPVDAPQRPPQLSRRNRTSSSSEMWRPLQREPKRNTCGSLPARQGCASIPRLVCRPHLLATGIAKNPSVQRRGQDHRDGAQPGGDACLLPQYSCRLFIENVTDFEEAWNLQASRARGQPAEGLRVSGLCCRPKIWDASASTQRTCWRSGPVPR